MPQTLQQMDSEPAQPVQRQDAAGRQRLLSNVVSGWFAHGITVVLGFIMPRIIHESVGQTALGVWDLGWSVVSYLAFSGLGLSSATTHYVSWSNAAGQPQRIAHYSATVFYWQLLMALLLGLLMAAGVATLHQWIPASLAGYLNEIRWIAALLGLAILAGLAGDVGQGVLRGTHRADVDDAVAIGADVALALSMVAVLLAGYGIRGLAAVTLLVKAAAAVMRLYLARRHCPRFSLDIREARRDLAVDVLRFGFKTSVGVLPALLVQQSGRLLLAAHAGPAALAILSRPMAITAQIIMLLERFGNVLPSMASGLAGSGRGAQIQRFTLRAGKAAVLLALPLVTVFAVFGNEIIALWMGPEFVHPGLPWIFALMALLSIDRGVAARILSGLNAHGRVSCICLLTAALVFVPGWLMLRPLDITDAAVLLAVSMGGGVSLPHFLLTCRRVGISPRTYLGYVWAKPLVANAVFGGCLVAARQSLLGEQFGLALLWLAVGLVLLGLLYWCFAVDRAFHASLRQRLFDV